MQKIMSLIGLGRKVNQVTEADDDSRPFIAKDFNATPKATAERTRPVYRIGKRDPSDIYRAIDLSG